MITYNSKEEAHLALLAINQGIDHSYLFPLVSTVDKRLPRKEVLEEAKTDLEEMLNSIEFDNLFNNTLQIPTSRIIKYQEIVNLLLDIPAEDFIRNKQTIEFTEALREFTRTYSALTWQGSSITESKYGLISAKVDLQEGNSLGTSNFNSEKLIRLADKYVELTKIKD